MLPSLEEREDEHNNEVKRQSNRKNIEQSVVPKPHSPSLKPKEGTGSLRPGLIRTQVMKMTYEDGRIAVARERIALNAVDPIRLSGRTTVIKTISRT